MSEVDEGTPLTPRREAEPLLASEVPSRLSRDVALLLRAIPAEDQEPEVVQNLAVSAGLSSEPQSGIGDAVAGLLSAFDVLQFSVRHDGLACVKARNRYSLYFIHSLAAYLDENRPVLSDWYRHPAVEGPFLASETLSGPQFLHLIERKRSAGREGALPLRRTEVVQLLIKAPVLGMKRPAYLMQFDSRAQQYQLIGGHIRSSDGDADETMRRELEEELPGSHYVFGTVDQLVKICTFETIDLSRTFGVNTEYAVHAYQLRSTRSRLKLGPADRWVTDEELATGRTRDGAAVGNDFYHGISRRIGGGTDSLDWSLTKSQRRGLKEVLREHPWEIASIAVAIVLAVVAIVLTR